jgi:hypothetical protein
MLASVCTDVACARIMYTHTVIALLSVASADEGSLFVSTCCVFVHTHTLHTLCLHTHYDPSSADVKVKART